MITKLLVRYLLDPQTEYGTLPSSGVMPRLYYLKYLLRRIFGISTFTMKCLWSLVTRMSDIISDKENVVFDFTDGIYADFFYPIYVELKEKHPSVRLWVAYSAKFKKMDSRFDVKDFIPTPLVLLLRRKINVFASIPSSWWFRHSVGASRKVQIFHGFASMGSAFGKEFIESFDRVFITAKHLKSQLAVSPYQGLISPAKVVEVGYPKIDGIIQRDVPYHGSPRRIFYGPTYHRDISSVFTFLPELVNYAILHQIELIIKLHPLLLYRHNLDFSGGIDWVDHIQSIEKQSTTVRLLPTNLPFKEVREHFLSSDLFVTDVSGLGYEFCLITGRPVVFLGNKLKIPLADLNTRRIEKYLKLPEIAFRGVIGPVIEQPGDLSLGIQQLDKEWNKYNRNIQEFRETFTYNVGNASSVAASEIMKLQHELSDSI